MFKDFCKNLLNYLLISLTIFICLILAIIGIVIIGSFLIKLHYWAIPILFFLIIIILAWNKTYKDNHKENDVKFHDDWYNLTCAYEDLTQALHEKNGNIESCRYEDGMFSRLIIDFKEKYGEKNCVYKSYVQRYNDLKAFYKLL